jgi:glycosyltransferase involved in cell wall biosynthesis
VRIVIDGLPIRGDNSLSIVSEHLLAGWQLLENGDELHLVVRSGAEISVPDSVRVHEVKFGRLRFVSRLTAQSFRLPRLCRSVDADVMLGVLPATSVAPLPCPRAVIAWDFRYRLRPEQFSRKTKLLRRVSYAIGFRQADGVACISDRTRRDLVAFHPRLAKVPVRVAHLGADHVDSWPVRRAGEAYAIAFGHFSNKNVDLVLQSWAALRRHPGDILPLRLVGVPASERDRLEARVVELGLADVVTVNPWLSKTEFQEAFASSSLVVFPSDFEGFGLPAVEAMRLGIPVVITPEPALLEVTAGHATVVEGEGPEALAQAVLAARDSSPEALAAAERHAAGFTWAHFASDVRGLLGEALAPAAVKRPRRLRPVPVRLGAAVAAGLFTVGGATAVAYALSSPSKSHPSSVGSGSAATSSTAVGTQTSMPGGNGKNSGGHGALGSHTSTTGAASGPEKSSSTGQAPPNSSNQPGAVPPVTVPPVTVPPVTVPSVTVPTTVCSASTTTTITTPLTVPCSVAVSASCACP